MITSLSLKNVASYDAGGINLTSLKKINFIYGANGSGKTTITKLVSSHAGPGFENCGIIWENGQRLKALVYNKEFRDANFGKGKIDGVFTLGKASKKQTDEIEEKEVIRKDLVDKGKQKAETKKKFEEEKAENESSFREIIWVEIYKKHENDFKDAFMGSIASKDRFKSKVIEEFENNKNPLATIDVLKERAETIFGRAPLPMTRLSLPASARLDEIENNTIWNKKIIGEADVDIARLIQKLNINDWVNEGKNYLRDDNICPFCQSSTITVGFRKQLSEYFDEAFLADTALVSGLAEEYTQFSSNLINQLQQIESTERGNNLTKLPLEKFSAYLQTFVSLCRSNEELLSNKIKEPSRSIDLTSTSEQTQLIMNLLEIANREIDGHNRIVSNYLDEKSRLIKDIWRFMTDAHKVIIRPHIDKQTNADKAIAGVEAYLQKQREQLKETDRELKELRKTVTGVEASIVEINHTLTAFGFHNFSIVPFKAELNKYQIQRENGTVADATMSEGEITFITFLYFLQLVKGSVSEADIAEDRILVIDDPISSLDSNVLFIVSSLLKQIIRKITQRDIPCNVKQLILLTHNVYFHKEVSFVESRLSQSNSDRSFWILRKNHNVSKIQACGHENPISNSYELLWKELRNRDHNSDITLQNTMRRIIENYFKILGHMGDEQLTEKFEDPGEQQVCRSLLCWINDGSHSIPDDLYLEQPDDTIDRYLDVFQKIFKHTRHQAHYDMMMGITA